MSLSNGVKRSIDSQGNIRWQAACHDSVAAITHCRQNQVLYIQSTTTNDTVILYQRRRRHGASSASGDKMAHAFNARKAAQVIALFVMKSGRPSLDVLKAIKLVYLADRESMSKYGFPILDECHVSMPHGPVNSTTYRHVNGEYDLEACGWSNFLEDRANHQIAAVNAVTEDDLDELSDADIKCVSDVWNQFGHMNKWEIRDWTHDRKNIPEWEDPNGSSRPIPLERIMTLLGVDEADRQAGIVESFREIDSLFARLRS